MAHGVYLEDDEIALLKKRGTSIIHCPASNTNLNSGLCDVQRLIKAGLTVGLGTDVSGGNSVSILHSLTRALDVSKHIDFFNKHEIRGTGVAKTPNRDYQQLTYKQAFHLATLGGAKALSLDQVTGNFAVGKDFDALLVDVSIMEQPHRSLNVDELVEKFIYTGDDRNILNVFVAGRKVKGQNCQPNQEKTRHLLTVPFHRETHREFITLVIFVCVCVYGRITFKCWKLKDF